MEKEKTDNKEFAKHFLDTAKNSFVVFISVIFGYLLGFVINFILARYFGAKIVGQFTLVKSSITILIIFSTFGFNGGLLKYISKFRAKSDKQKLRFIIFITLSLSFIFSVGLSVLVYFNRNYFSILFNDQELSRLLVYGAWLIIPMTLIKVYSGLYRGYKKVSFYKISNLIIKKIFFVLLLLFFVLYKFKNINYVINAYLFANLLIFVYLSIKFYSIIETIIKIDFFKKIKKTFDKKLFKEYILFSITLIFISFIHIILSRVDRIMIGIYKTSKDVGIYNIAAMVGTFINLILVSSNSIFSPIISELYSQKKKKLLNDLYSSITKWIIVLTLPLMISIVFFSNQILKIFGNEFVIGSNVLILVGVGYFVSASAGASGYILNMCGKEKLLLLNNFLLIIMNIILNIILIPKYSILGAAIATSLSLSIFNIIKVIEIKYIFKIFPYTKKYIFLFLNFIAIFSLSFFMSKNFPNIMTFIFVVIFNLIISIFIAYIFKDKNDKIIYKYVKNKFNQIFK